MPLRLKNFRSSTHAIAAGIAGLVLASGCGPSPDLEWTPAENTLRLIPEVRDGATFSEDGAELHFQGVNEAVESHFGSLTTPSVWPLLPVEFGGDPATVAGVSDASVDAATTAEEAETPLEEITISLGGADGASQFPTLSVGSQVGWTAGTYEGKSHRVKSFDATTGDVTLAGTFDDGLPDEGDELLVNTGGMLHEGRTLYARHCLHCHGAGGAGNGPTAKYLQPKPRDFRLGRFKFTSTGSPVKARRDDLRSTLDHGVPGTSMPAFRLLADHELEVLVEYVRWLSMRGEYEYQLSAIALSNGFSIEDVEDRLADGETRDEIIEGDVRDFLEVDFAEMSVITGEDIAEAWSEAEDESSVVMPTIPRVADTPESRAIGRKLYLSDSTKCAACHGVYGKGDGHQTESFQKNAATNENYPVPGLHDDWGNLLRPRDLTQGVYRGGRRPIDLYRRIHAGIKGTPMPGFGGNLSEEEIWHVVNYVLAAPYEPLPKPGQGTSVVSTGH
jgi:mono/diheme cytochrome c family protein